MRHTTRPSHASLLHKVVVCYLSCAVPFGMAQADFAEGVAADARGDFATAHKEFMAEASRGDAAAQGTVGFMYANGRSVPKDDQKAIIWYRKAADQGHPQAQFDVGGMYDNGQGVPKDEQRAMIWYRKAADQGHASAQFNVGSMYANGQGVPKDERQAVLWYRKAADQGHAGGQYNLGLMYANGQGAPKDEQQAYFWWLLASAQGLENATRDRGRIEPRLSSAQRAAAQAAARSWTPVVAGGSMAGAGADPFASRPRSQLQSAGPDSTGSGFAVASNRLVTNAHVVEGCARVRLAGGIAAKVHAVDRRSDLALLEVNGLTTPATLRAGRLRQGDAVSVVGFPLAGVLASGAQVTAGNVSALAGMQNDSRFIQISAPVQPGNSGGPLVDASGNVVGVVVSKLNALKMAEITGDIPQNVNFAVSPLVLQGFLEANGVDYQSAPSTRTMSTADVAEKAKRFTFLVECWK